MASAAIFKDRLPGSGVSWNMVQMLGQEGQVTDSFWIGQTEVTWELFDFWALQLDLNQEQQVAGIDAIAQPSKPYSVIFSDFGHHGHPAICVSFKAAVAFCDWLSGATGRPYRLPTEAEWESACLEKPDTDLDKCSWNWDNAEDTTHPVGSKEPNALGVFDMLGNVAEWCQEGVVRGGSWKTKPADLSPAHLEAPSPTWNESDPQIPKSEWWLANGQHVGLRLVCDHF